jgi:hypothetical protein
VDKTVGGRWHNSDRISDFNTVPSLQHSSIMQITRSIRKRGFPGTEGVPVQIVQMEEKGDAFVGGPAHTYRDAHKKLLKINDTSVLCVKQLE